MTDFNSIAIEDACASIGYPIRNNDNRELAIKSFDVSDYKKILVWLKKQKRLSKSAAKELREIIDGSQPLKFYGMDNIKGEIDSLVEAELGGGLQDETTEEANGM